MLERERPVAVIVQLGGQTPLGLAEAPSPPPGIAIAGTSPDAIALAEDRERFAALCRDLDIPQPPHGASPARVDQAAEVAGAVGYPVLVRPSFVLGGRAMRIVCRRGRAAPTHLARVSGGPGPGSISRRPRC